MALPLAPALLRAAEAARYLFALAVPLPLRCPFAWLVDDATNEPLPAPPPISSSASASASAQGLTAVAADSSVSASMLEKAPLPPPLPLALPLARLARPLVARTECRDALARAEGEAAGPGAVRCAAADAPRPLADSIHSGGLAAGCDG